MRSLGLNPESSSTSSRLLAVARAAGIDLKRFTAGRRVDLIGRCFDALTVLASAKSCKHRQRAWLCECRCGKTIVYTTGVLLSQRTRHHCGCGQYRNGKDHFNWKGCEGISGRYWGQVKSNAKRRGIGFSITLREVWRVYTAQGGQCAVTGCPVQGRDASLDRIDSNFGYVRGNVQWVHKTVNRMKGTLTMTELVNWAGKIVIYDRLKAKSVGNQSSMARRG